MCGAILSGARATSFPLHQHNHTHEAWFVLEGVLTLLLGDKEYKLTPGCYANIPAGTPHGPTYGEHRSRVVTWIFGGKANRLYQGFGSPYPGTGYPETAEAPDWEKLSEAVDTELMEPLSGARVRLRPKCGCARFFRARAL